jgi:hypothetical protein
MFGRVSAQRRETLRGLTENGSNISSAQPWQTGALADVLVRLRHPSARLAASDLADSQLATPPGCTTPHSEPFALVHHARLCDSSVAAGVRVSRPWRRGENVPPLV